MKNKEPKEKASSEVKWTILGALIYFIAVFTLIPIGLIKAVNLK